MTWWPDAVRQLPELAGKIEEAIIFSAPSAWQQETAKSEHVPGVWLVVVDGDSSKLCFVPENNGVAEIEKFIADGRQPYDVNAEFVMLGCNQVTGERARVNLPLSPTLMFESTEQQTFVLERFAQPSPAPPPEYRPFGGEDVKDPI